MSKLTFTRLICYTIAVIGASIFAFGVVVVQELPSFMGFFFGFLIGGAWVALLWLYCDWFEQKREVCL